MENFENYFTGPAHRNEDETWLFPFIGDRDLINGQEKNFESFLASTTLRAGETEIRAKAPSPPPPTHNQHDTPTWGNSASLGANFRFVHASCQLRGQ